ncbi:hypothetical protein [Vibrio campbellii]|uniref:hypothetical protein n=1 Tax=Vibrio campbellii TaxID=680 RepID=UPI00249CCA7A|nr:hypothetical protein [Vibrio campbellii]
MENRIKFALFLKGWSFDGGDKAYLKANAEKALTTEFEEEMHDNIYCPECCAPLFRSPRDKDYSDNGRAAYFAHKRSIKTDCGLRTKKAEGKKYLNEEEAKKAIQDEELVVVEGFIQDKPIAPNKKAKEYDQTEVEELDGPVTSVPIGRHRGETFNLPSKFKTVKGIVKNFDENLHRYFFFQIVSMRSNFKIIFGVSKLLPVRIISPNFIMGKLLNHSMPERHLKISV